MKRNLTGSAAAAVALAILGSVSACGRADQKAGTLFGLAGTSSDVTSDETLGEPSGNQPERNAFLMISKSALEEMIRVPITDKRTIKDNFNGVAIQANASTNGKLTIELVPSDIDTQLTTFIDAQTHIDISGAHDPRSDIHIEMTGTADVKTQSIKPMHISLKSAMGKPVKGTFKSLLEVTGLDVTATGWFSGYKRARAAEEAWATVNRELPKQQIAIGQRVSKEIGNVVDERAGEFILNFNATLVRTFREWFVDSGYLPGKQLFQSTTEAMWFSSLGDETFEDTTVVRAPVDSVALTGEQQAPLMIGVTQEAAEYAAEKAIGGKTIPAAALSQLFVALGASAVPPVWTTFKYAGVSLVFAQKKPISIKFTDGRMTLTANFEAVSQHAIRQTASSLELTYEPRMADDQSIEFVRVGEPVLKAASSRLDPSQLLVQFSDEVLKPGLHQSFALPLPDLSSVIPALKRMRLKFAHAEEGWIRVGASLDAIK